MVDERIAAAADALRQSGATEVYVFGSRGGGQPSASSDLDLAAHGIPPSRYFAAVSRASIAAGLNVDLVDLDDNTPMVEFLLQSGDLVRVG